MDKITTQYEQKEIEMLKKLDDVPTLKELIVKYRRGREQFKSDTNGAGYEMFDALVTEAEEKYSELSSQARNELKKLKKTSHPSPNKKPTPSTTPTESKKGPNPGADVINVIRL